jgi:hypothetical protein
MKKNKFPEDALNVPASSDLFEGERVYILWIGAFFERNWVG